jgi:hypothetical protein
VDIERGIFYTMGYNDTTQIVSLIGFDRKGKLVCNWPLPFVTSAFVGVGEAVDVDSTNGEVFCMGLKVRRAAVTLMLRVESFSTARSLHTDPELVFLTPRSRFPLHFMSRLTASTTCTASTRALAPFGRMPRSAAPLLVQRSCS